MAALSWPSPAGHRVHYPAARACLIGPAGFLPPYKGDPPRNAARAVKPVPPIGPIGAIGNGGFCGATKGTPVARTVTATVNDLAALSDDALRAEIERVRRLARG